MSKAVVQKGKERSNKKMNLNREKKFKVKNQFEKHAYKKRII